MSELDVFQFLSRANSNALLKSSALNFMRSKNIDGLIKLADDSGYRFTSKELYNALAIAKNDDFPPFAEALSRAEANAAKDKPMDYFLLDPRNKIIVEGENVTVMKMAYNALLDIAKKPIAVLAIGFLVALVFFMGNAAYQELGSTGLTYYLVIVTLGIVILVWFKFSSLRLLTGGELIAGEIVSIKDALVKDKYDQEIGYNVTLEYQFISPVSGQLLKGKGKRHQLLSWRYPAADSKVWVAYHNDRVHRVL